MRFKELDAEIRQEKEEKDYLGFIAKLKGEELTSTQKFIAKVARSIPADAKIIQTKRIPIKTLVDSYNGATDEEMKETARFIKSTLKTKGAKKWEELQSKKKRQLIFDEIEEK